VRRLCRRRLATLLRLSTLDGRRFRSRLSLLDSRRIDRPRQDRKLDQEKVFDRRFELVVDGVHKSLGRVSESSEDADVKEDERDGST
jgi:hypothetical protein